VKTGGVPPPLTVVTLKMAPSHAKFSNQVPPRTSRSLISEFDVLCFMSPNPGPNWGARRDLSGIFRSIEGVHERPRFCQGRISTGRGSALPREGWHHVVKQRMNSLASIGTIEFPEPFRSPRRPGTASARGKRSGSGTRSLVGVCHPATSSPSP